MCDLKLQTCFVFSKNQQKKVSGSNLLVDAVWIQSTMKFNALQIEWNAWVQMVFLYYYYLLYCDLISPYTSAIQKNFTAL